MTSSETVPLDSANALKTDAPTTNESGLLKLPDLPNFNLNFPKLDLPTFESPVPPSSVEEAKTTSLQNGVEEQINC
jgi:hypothetical protein